MPIFGTREPVVVNRPIASLNNNSSIKGDFFLGCGSIEEKEYYFFFKKFREGSFVRGKVPASGTIITEVDDMEPNLMCSTTKTLAQIGTQREYQLKALGDMNFLYLKERSYKGLSYDELELA